jgi:CheY-like chemotaxis protein
VAGAGQIEQVLVNLAINARDAMAGGGTLSIDAANIVVDDDFTTTGPPLRAGRHVRLRVGDTGTGIPAEIIKHVFEPFFTTKADAPIPIHSQPGVGTMLSIMMPVTDEVAVAVSDQPAYHRIPTGETVLVVEDEQALRAVTERTFTRGGYQAMTAAGGAEATALAAGYPGEIHLLLTDVVMPHMLGKEVAERVRDIKPTIEVLYMSGYVQPVLASQGRLDRDVNLIDKPFSAAAIIERAGQILMTPRHHMKR